MRDLRPSLLMRILRKLGAISVYPQFKTYRSSINSGHPLFGIRARIVGNAAADSAEFFDHYDAYSFWVAQKIAAREKPISILDVGSPKMMNAILSANNDVTALVLQHCGDEISRVKYIAHDVCNPLPFPDRMFDVFTSSVTLPLIGLGRYGDKLDAWAAVTLIKELDRVMRPDADLLISMCLGRNILNFNNGWFIDLPTIEKLFANWKLQDYLVDQCSSPKTGAKAMAGPRFSADASVDKINIGDYRVIFLHFRRAQ